MKMRVALVALSAILLVVGGALSMRMRAGARREVAA